MFVIAIPCQSLSDCQAVVGPLCAVFHIILRTPHTFDILYDDNEVNVPAVSVLCEVDKNQYRSDTTVDFH